MTLHESQIPVAEGYCSACLIKSIKSADENPEYVTIKKAGINEAEYQGRKVQLGKPMRGDVKKFKVYVKNAKDNVVKVNFGDPNMRIRKSNPARGKKITLWLECNSLFHII